MFSDSRFWKDYPFSNPVGFPLVCSILGSFRLSGVFPLESLLSHPARNLLISSVQLITSVAALQVRPKYMLAPFLPEVIASEEKIVPPFHGNSYPPAPPHCCLGSEGYGSEVVLATLAPYYSYSCASSPFPIPSLIHTSFLPVFTPKSRSTSLIATNAAPNTSLGQPPLRLGKSYCCSVSRCLQGSSVPSPSARVLSMAGLFFHRCYC